MLELVIYACIVAAALCFLYAFIALPKELALQSAVKDAASHVESFIKQTAVTTTRGQRDNDATTPQATLTDGTDLVNALAKLGEAMGKLRQGTAALLLAFGLLVFAGTAAGVEDKLADASAGKPQSAAVRE